MNVPTPKPDAVTLWGLKPPEQAEFPPYLVYAGQNRALTQPECNTLIDLGERKGFNFGTVGNSENGSSRDDPAYRSVQVCQLMPHDLDRDGQDLKWLYAKISERVSWANQRYDFNLSGFCEPMQMLKYTMPQGERPAGHYKQHQDFGGGIASLRKMSCVVQLSPREAYDGCRLHLQLSEDREIAETGQGDMIVFPSWTPHYVTPLTEGVRYAIAIWVGGPRFR